MAQVDITGIQHYTQGIGHPKADVESLPPVEWTDSTGTALRTPAGGSVAVGGGSPVSVTGTGTVGSVLTAALQSGWSATGYQWTRAGVSISGATASTYTLQAADAGTSVACRVSGLANLSSGIAVTAAVVTPSTFVVTPVVFDGSYLSKTDATLTGVADSPIGSASLFLTSNSTIGSYRTLLTAGRLTIGIDDQQKLYVYLRDSTTLKSFTFRTSAIAATGHYAIEWNTSGAAGAKIANILYNGVAQTLTVTDADVGFSANYTGVSFVGAAATGASPSYADIGELMLWHSTFANWSVNISKVFANGAAVDPGANGSLVFGVTPVVYFSTRNSALASTFATNLGSGGAFVANGLTLQRADEAVVSYGDSLTFGTGSSGPSKGWTSIVTHGLNRPIKQLNYGVGGISASDVANIMASGGFSKPAASVPVGLTRARIWTLEGGYNSVSGIVSNGLDSAFTPFAAQMVNTMLALEPSAKWIFIGIPTGNITANNALYGDRSNLANGRNAAIVAANNWLSAQYGAHFLDLNAWLIANGLSIGNYGAAITPTATDLDDIANNTVPSSLRSPDGSVHWNDFGQYAVSVAVLEKLTALGYN